MSKTRVAALLLILGGVAFGAMGGEYSTVDWWKLRGQVSDEDSAIARLKLDIDSLSRAAKALETDPAAQERAAREAFGMLRPGEILYRVEPAKP